MTILWLILKIVFILLGILLGIVFFILLAFLFLPLEYHIKVEKYEQLTYALQFKIFYLIRVVWDNTANKRMKILFCGRTIKEIPVQEVEEQVEKTEDVVTKATKAEVKNVSKKEVSMQTVSNEKETVHTPPKEHLKKAGQPIKPSAPSKKWIDWLKIIWMDENRIPFIRFCKALLKDLWHAIRPKTLHFQLIFGLEDPAETGMWLAKLMALYPFYAAYGNIVGDFEQASLEGHVTLWGKTNFYRFIAPLIKFVAYKEVRNYITLLMKIGKDE